MNLRISKTLFILLLILVWISFVILLKPDTTLLESKEIELINVKKKETVKKLSTENSPKVALSNIWIRQKEQEPFFFSSKPVLRKIEVTKKVKKIPEVIKPYIPQVMQPVRPVPHFKYVGQLVENKQITAFLQGASGPFTAKLGDVVDGQWRIESIAVDSINLIYLPSNDTLRLNIR